MMQKEYPKSFERFLKEHPDLGLAGKFQQTLPLERGGVSWEQPPKSYAEIVKSSVPEPAKLTQVSDPVPDARIHNTRPRRTQPGPVAHGPTGPRRSERLRLTHGGSPLE